MIVYLMTTVWTLFTIMVNVVVHIPIIFLNLSKTVFMLVLMFFAGMSIYAGTVVLVVTTILSFTSLKNIFDFLMYERAMMLHLA